MNSECVGGQFGKSDVYDRTPAILNSYRITDSRAKGIDNTRECKGTRWEGQQRAENRASGGDQSGEGDN